MERRAGTTSSRGSPRTARGVRKDNSPASGERSHRASKAVKPTERTRKKESLSRQPGEEASNPEEPEESKVRLNSTVVNVDSVRDAEALDERTPSLGLLELERQEEGLKQRTLSACEWLLTSMAVIIIILTFPVSIWLCVKVIREHERAVVYRLGHLLQGKPKGPGLLFFIPFLDVCQKVDIRLKMLKVLPHTVVTKDLVSTELSTVCYYRVENVSLCYTALAGISAALQVLAQVSDREIVAHHIFTQILMDRKKVTKEIQVALDSVTCQWGIKVERVEIEDIHLPAELQQRVAAEAEAKRLAQIKIIVAEGEKAACEALKASLDSLSGSPAAVHLRLLQLLHALRADQPPFILNLPSDLLTLPTDLFSLPNPARRSLTADEAPKSSHTDSPMM